MNVTVIRECRDCKRTLPGTHDGWCLLGSSCGACGARDGEPCLPGCRYPVDAPPSPVIDAIGRIVDPGSATVPDGAVAWDDRWSGYTSGEVFGIGMLAGSALTTAFLLFGRIVWGTP